MMPQLSESPVYDVGADLSDLYMTMYQDNYKDTTYMPVYDYLHAVNPIKVGTDKMQATMKHATAGFIIGKTKSTVF